MLFVFLFGIGSSSFQKDLAWESEDSSSSSSTEVQVQHGPRNHRAGLLEIISNSLLGLLGSNFSRQNIPISRGFQLEGSFGSGLLNLWTSEEDLRGRSNLVG